MTMHINVLALVAVVLSGEYSFSAFILNLILHSAKHLQYFISYTDNSLLMMGRVARLLSENK